MFERANLESAGIGHPVTGSSGVLACSDGGGDVHSGVAIEEICSLELEADVLDRHHREILDPDCMRDSKAVPDDRIVACHRAILQEQSFF